MQNKTTTPNNVTALFEELKALEEKIAQKLGAQIFDYLFLFSDKSIEQVILPNITSDTSDLFNQYLKIYRNICQILKIESHKGSSLIEEFLEALRDIYQLRFFDAKYLFSEYQLERVPTKMETKIMKDYKAEETALNIGIFIENAFVEDKNGEIDYAATVKKEEQEHLIKSYLSAYPEGIRLKSKLYYSLIEITTRGMVPRMYQDELLQINEELLTETISYFSAKVYDYLKRGFLPRDARANVLSFYNEILKKQNYRLAPQMEDLQKNLQTILQERLAEIKDLRPDTVSELIDQYLELIKVYLQAGLLLPKTLFNLQFRAEEDGVYLDSYLVFETGELSSAPVETYKIALSDEAKAVIFEHVTNGIENPEFTLEDYLAAV